MTTQKEKQMGRNPILMGKAEELKPFYYVVLDEGNGFFEKGEDLLAFLQKNDPIECGCKLMTDKEFTDSLDKPF